MEAVPPPIGWKDVTVELEPDEQAALRTLVGQYRAAEQWALLDWLAYLPVGDHPQRIRHGYVPESVVATWTEVGTNPGPNYTGSGGLIPTVSTILGRLLYLVNPLLPLR